MGVVIRVLDHISQCYSNSDGDIIRGKILENLRSEKPFVVSFENVDSVSSSFINSALIDLLESYSFDVIKQKISFSNSSRSINDLIKKRFAFEVNERKKLIGV